MSTMPDVVDAQLRLQFLASGRDAMLPSVVASDPAHDPPANAFPVESLKARRGSLMFKFSALTTQHSEPHKSSESTSDS
jgi:hypothetical protein